MTGLSDRRIKYFEGLQEQRWSPAHSFLDDKTTLRPESPLCRIADKKMLSDFMDFIMPGAEIDKETLINEFLKTI